MKNKDTLVYIGSHSEISKKFAKEGYLVNEISPNRLNSCIEYLHRDGQDIEVARDTIEDDASVIIMDTDFLKGIEDISEKVRETIKTRLKKSISKEEVDMSDKDEIAQRIEKVLDSLPEKLEDIIDINVDGETLDKAVDNIFNKVGNNYVRAILDQIPGSLILGAEKHRMLSLYMHKMQEAANRRIKDSRYDSGAKRDLLEGDLRWRPTLVLTSNKENSQVTNGTDVSQEYIMMDVIKRILGKMGLEIGMAGVVNTRTVDRIGTKTIETEKISKAVKWAKFLAEAEEKSNKNVSEFMHEAFEVMDILDVNGGIVNHSLRTAQLMKFLLESAYKDSENIYSGDKVPKKDWKAYIIGALFHDNGKLLNISRPDLPNFLSALQTNATPRLPSEGLDAVKSHAEIGGDNIREIIENSDIVGKKDYLDIVATISYYHQEFFLGDKGYSIDKKHDQNMEKIPLAAQYMAIVDVFDAIIGRRNYNKQLDQNRQEKLPTMEDAITIMAKQVGVDIKMKGKTMECVTDRNWRITDKVSFERKDGFFIDNENAHFNQNLLICFFESLQKEAQRFKDGKKTKFDFAVDKNTGRLIIESIGGIGFDQYLHRDSINMTKKSPLSKPAELGKKIQQQWRERHGRDR